MAIYDKKLDAVIKQQITSELNQIEVPPLDDQWKKFRDTRLNQNNILSHKPFNIKWAAAALLLIAVGTYSLFKPSQVNAFGERIIEYFNKIVGRTTVNQVIDEKSTDMPSMEEPELNIMLPVDKLSFSSLVDLKSAAPFDLALPNYLPIGLKFKEGIITDNQNSNEIKLIYEQNGNELIFIQRKYIENIDESSLSILYDIEDNYTKKIFINNIQIFIYNLNNITKLYWKNNNFNFILISYIPDLSEEEMINIAKSIKY